MPDGRGKSMTFYGSAQKSILPVRLPDLFGIMSLLTSNVQPPAPTLHVNIRCPMLDSDGAIAHSLDPVTVQQENDTSRQVYG